MPWTTLCSLDELTEGAAKYVEVEGYQLAVFLHEGKPHTLDNYCPHAGGSMAGGYIDDGCAVCPWHNWPFRLESGHLKGSDAVTIGVYPTQIGSDTDGSEIVQADLPALK